MLIRSYTATLQRGPCFCFLCCCFPIAALGSWNYQTPSFKLETSTPTPFSSLRSPFSWAPLQSAGIPAISNTLEYWGGNMWGIWMIDPSAPPLHPLPSILALCYLLRGRRGQRRPGFKDEVITAYQWQWGGRPADLWGDASWAKSRGTSLREMSGFSSKSWPPRCPECPHDEDKKLFSEYFAIFKHILPIPAPLSNQTPKLSSHTFSQGPLTSPHGCREAPVYGSN